MNREAMGILINLKTFGSVACILIPPSIDGGSLNKLIYLFFNEFLNQNMSRVF